MSSLEDGFPLLAPLLGGVLRSGGSRYDSNSIGSTTLSGNNYKYKKKKYLAIKYLNNTKFPKFPIILINFQCCDTPYLHSMLLDQSPHHR